MLHSLPVDGTVVVLLTLTIIYLSLKQFLFLLCHNHKLLLKRGQLKIIAEVRNANCVRVSYLQNQDFILKANHCLLLGVSCKPLCVLFENCPLAVLKYSLPEGNGPGLSSLIVLLVGHLPARCRHNNRYIALRGNLAPRAGIQITSWSIGQKMFIFFTSHAKVNDLKYISSHQSLRIKRQENSPHSWDYPSMP